MAETQLWIGMEPVTPAKLEPVQNSAPHGWPKPERGGLWTSTWLAGLETSDWVRCSRREGYCNPDKATHWYLLTPDPTARLITIHTYADLKRWIRRYHFPSMRQTWDRQTQMYFDFEAAAKEWDGIHLTEQGQEATRLSFPIDLYGWDTESTLWFRWCFTGVEQIEPRRQTRSMARK